MFRLLRLLPMSVMGTPPYAAVPPLSRSASFQLRDGAAMPVMGLGGWADESKTWSYVAMNFDREPAPKWVDMAPHLNDVHQRVPNKKVRPMCQNRRTSPHTHGGVLVVFDIFTFPANPSSRRQATIVLLVLLGGKMRHTLVSTYFFLATNTCPFCFGFVARCGACHMATDFFLRVPTHFGVSKGNRRGTGPFRASDSTPQGVYMSQPGEETYNAAARLH